MGSVSLRAHLEGDSKQGEMWLKVLECVSVPFGET